MTSKEALERIKNYMMILKDLSYSDCTDIEEKFLLDYETIKHDLEILELIKKHYEMNGFNELIPVNFDEDGKWYLKIEKWLNN